MQETRLRKLILSLFVTASMAMSFLPWIGVNYREDQMSKADFETGMKKTETYLDTLYSGFSLFSGFAMMDPDTQAFMKDMMPMTKRAIHSVQDSGLSQYELTDLIVRFSSIVLNHKTYAAQVLGEDTEGVSLMLKGISAGLILLFAAAILFWLFTIRSIWNNKGKGFRIAFLIVRILTFAAFILLMVVLNKYFAEEDIAFGKSVLSLKPYIWSYLALFLALPAGFHSLYLSRLPGMTNASEDAEPAAPAPVIETTTPDSVIPEAEPWICEACGSANGSTKNFCENCGTRKPSEPMMTCPHCGKPTPAGSKFCGACGKAL